MISASCCMRFCKYTTAGSACRVAARSSAFEISSASHSFGVPITYGILYFSQSIFATRSPTAETTRLTSASADLCNVFKSSPIAHTDITCHPYFCRFSFKVSTFFCGPKSSGVTPNRFTVREEGSLFSCLSVSLTNRFAISSSAMPAPYT